MWDPATYQRYGDERSRPFADLLARVGAQRPRAVVDLGCGPGTLTATLAERWPGARVSGLDSSAGMIERAAALGAAVGFTVADVRDWRPGPDVDVVVCNAVLQWVPDHDRLLAGWAHQLPPGAWLAVQVPGNFDAPSHRALRAVAAGPRWATRVAPALSGRYGSTTAQRPGGAAAPVADPVDYARLLADAGCAVDAWETTYVHLLPADSPEHPVLRWMDGTALRPVHAALAGDDAAWTAFRAELGERLAQAYPVRGDQVYFPFRRIFVVARTAAGA